VEKNIATEVLVFWFVGFGQTKSSFALGHFAVAAPTARDISELWSEAVEHCHNHLLRPICGVCDGASENEKWSRQICGANGHYYIHPDTGEPIFIISCQTHLLKKLR